MLSLAESSRLLSMIAGKFGYDIVLLKPRELEFRSEIFDDDVYDVSEYVYAVFGYLNSYEVVQFMLMPDKKYISLKYIDGNGDLRRNDSMYNELVETLYGVLENGGALSDGKRELHAADMPEFMVECSLRGCG